MLRVGVIAAVFLHAISCSCPIGYALQWNGICTKFEHDGITHSYDKLHSDAVDICHEHDAIPVIIRSQEEQDYWANIARQYEYPIILGLRCNNLTNSYEWDDSSAVDFKPSNVNSRIHGNCTTQGFNWAMAPSGDWITYAPVSASSAFVLYCMAPLPTLNSPDNECVDFPGEEGVCFQVGETAKTWSEAQAICKSFGGDLATIVNEQENVFVRELAASRGLVNGVHIGSTIKNGNFSWIDGTQLDYDNLMPGFPVDGVGECLAMVTNNDSGNWVNMNCDEKIPFACVKRAKDIEPTCGSHAYIEGEVIHSPGFPRNASIPCDFFLKVDPGMLVEVEILVLEANSCCDSLILSEGVFGGHVVATLTGSVASGAKYLSSSNMMRVSWQPNGGVNVRGMMITFRGVPVPTTTIDPYAALRNPYQAVNV